MLTDFYEFSMANGYFLEGEIGHKNAVFDYFFRKNPFGGSYAVVAGIEQFLDIISDFRFKDEDIEHLKQYDLDDGFLDYLAHMDNQIEVRGFSEGRIAFANEPILQVNGPLIQCQILETLLLNSINFPTLCASKANRMWLESGKQSILEFGARRAQGPNGANTATYASMIGGCSGTSNVMAAKQLGVKALGTIAHSWIMTFSSEYEAFKKYAEIYPNNSILLVDTYDTLKSGLPNAIKVGKELRERGYDLNGIRLDSGDLAELSRKAREMLDEAGFKDTKIVISNDVDEYFIREFKKNGGKGDTWGIGTKLVTAYDEAALSGVYKLSEFDKQPRIKISGDSIKTSIPSEKQVLRFYSFIDDKSDSKNSSKDLKMVSDVLFLRSEEKIECEAIQSPDRFDKMQIFDPFSTKTDVINANELAGFECMINVLFKNGKRTGTKLTWQDARRNMETDVKKLNKQYTKLKNPRKYAIMMSKSLNDLRNSLIKQHQQKI